MVSFGNVLSSLGRWQHKDEKTLKARLNGELLRSFPSCLPYRPERADGKQFTTAHRHAKSVTKHIFCLGATDSRGVSKISLVTLSLGLQSWRCAEHTGEFFWEKIHLFYRLGAKNVLRWADQNARAFRSTHFRCNCRRCEKTNDFLLRGRNKKS